MEKMEKFRVEIINEAKGKGLVVLCSFKDGDEIIIEKPVICCQFAWNTDYGYLACDNCMRPLETAEENVRRLTGNKDLILPYPDCCEIKKELTTECPGCGIAYCSNECFVEAFDKYHQSLCPQSKDKCPSIPLTVLKETWKQMHYPPETATIMLLARIIAFINQAKDKSAALSIFTQFCHKTVNDAEEIGHNLLGEKFIGQIDVLRNLMDNALNKENIPYWFTPEGFKSLLALVGTNGQGIGTSAFSQWVKNVTTLELQDEKRIEVDKFIDKLYDEMDQVVGTFLNNEGSGLYVLQSSINHSCLPNAVIEFPYSNSTLVVKAIRDIEPGEEICIGYLDECELERSRYSRQKLLSSSYLFVCHCEKCLAQADELNITTDEEEEEENDDENMFA